MEKEASLLFKPEELAEMVKHPGDRAYEALEAGKCDVAQEICQKAESSHKDATHDSYVVWNGQTLSYIYREFGLKDLRQDLRESLTPGLRPVVELFRNGVTKEAVAGLAQMCRTDCGKFSKVEEDRDKITFRLDQCGSGGRLVQEGRYAAGDPNPLAMVKEANVITGGRSDFPIFCTVCRMAETLMVEWLGYPAFVTDCCPEKGDPSFLHIYKDPKDIPSEYFSRIGKERDINKIKHAVAVSGGSLFTERERENLPRQYVKQAILAMKEGELELAKGYCKLSKNEWYVLHHFYRDWITGQLSFFYNNYGVDKLCDCVWETYNKCLIGPMIEGLGALDMKSQVEWLAFAFNQHAMHFRIEEDLDKFAFITEPCGSGGRLVDEGAYAPPKGFARIKEAHKVGYYLKDFPIYCVHCPTTNELIFQKKGPYFLIVDGDRMKKPENGCAFYIFKNPDAIPERFYQQVGMEKL